MTEPPVPAHDHAWSKVEGLQGGQFPGYVCDVCGAEWPPDGPELAATEATPNR